jgi:putative transposase
VIWQADHSLLDILIHFETEKPVKPWLTIIIDDHSRSIAGYYLSFEPPTAAQTALALRQAIWRKQDPRWQICGIPDVLYTDNGRDFTSRHIEQVCADLKIQLIFSTPGAPRGRGRIERFFETVNQMFLCELPGYAPVGSGVRGKPSLTMPELDSLLSNFLLDVYHRRQHAEINLTPGERWEKGGFLPRMPDSLEQLDLLLLAVAGTRKIHPDGIRFQGLRYVDLTLAA